MQAAFKRNVITVEDYLAGEQTSAVKHEYVDGAVFAMAGATPEHNEIAYNYQGVPVAL
jgi:Uma2 family endonuclease